MSYDTANPPYQIISNLLNGRSIFLYESTDAHGTVSGAGYFSDGSKHGMRVGDIVIVRTTSTGATTLHAVTAVAAKVGTGAVADNTPRAATISAAVLE